jgi:transposase
VGILAELGIISAKGRNGTEELLEIIMNGADSRIPLAARSILKVLAAQYSTIGSEIASIGKSILAWHRSCEPSRRLEGVQIGAWSGGLDRAGAEATHDWRQGQARQHHQAG